MLKVADPNFAERTRASFARQAIMQLLGAEMREVEAGRVLIALPFKPELTQQHGFFHGGATATIADSAGGYAGFTLFGPGESVLTVEFKLNLIAPADGDCLYAEGRVKKPGRTLTVCELEVWAERNPSQPQLFKVTEANITYVAIDLDGKPRPINPEQA